MKKLIICLIVFLFTLSSGISIAGQGNKQRGNHDQEQRQVQKYKKQHPQKYQRDRGHHYGHGYRDRYYGHRPQPPKHYRGHWRSWDDWDRYYRSHRHEYRHPRYYRDSRGSLYFEFETDEGRFAFSIGR